MAGAGLLVLGAPSGAASTTTGADASPVLSWSPQTSAGTFAYGKVRPHSVVYHQFKLTNSGNGTVSAVNVTLTGSAAFTKVKDLCTGTNLAPGGSCLVRIRYAPAIPGQTFTATLSATSSTPGAQARLGIRGQEARASSRVTTNPSNGGTVGSTTATDTAMLAGGYQPTGSITFAAYGPSPTADCTGTPADAETVTVSGDGSYTTPNGFTPTQAGTYYWTASYSGDGHSRPSASGCGSESVTISPASPSLTTTPSGSTVGSVVTDTATLSGGDDPTGSIAFAAYGPSQTADCTGTPVDAETVTVSGDGSYTTPNGFTPTQAGTYYWTASYSGDTNNSAIASGCDQEPVTITSSPPTAVNQSYNAVGNTTLAVGTSPTGPAASVSASDGLLNGDSGDASCGTLSVTGNTTPAHGTVTVNPDGTFTYLPNAGYSGTDTFQYTITCANSGQTATATATITVGTVVWYVDDSRAAAGNGESSAPFNTLAAANSAAGADSIIFLYQGNATYTGGLTMHSGESLWGQPHGLAVEGYTLVASGGGSNPTITNSGGDGIDLASNTDVEDVTVSDVSGNGINGQQVTGTVTVANSTLTGSAVNNGLITDTSGTVTVTVTGSTFSNSSNTTGNNDTGHGLDINADGSTDATVSVTNSTFAGNIGDEFKFATDSTATGTNSVTFSDNQATGVGVDGAGGSGALIEQSGDDTTAITIDGNNIQNVTANGIGVTNDGSAGKLSGTIDGNTVGSPAVANSGGGNSIGAYADGSSTVTLAITNNKLYQYDDFAGIYYIDREGSPVLNLTITGNTIADPAGSETLGGAWGIYGEGGAETGDAGTVCADITGNSLTGSGQTSLGSFDIEVDQNVAGVTYKLPGYTGGPTDTNAVANFLAANNGDSASNVTATVAGSPGFVGGSACPAP